MIQPAEAFTKWVSVLGSHSKDSPAIMVIGAQWQSLFCSQFNAFVYVMGLKAHTCELARQLGRSYFSCEIQLIHLPNVQ